MYRINKSANTNITFYIYLKRYKVRWIFLQKRLAGRYFSVNIENVVKKI